MIFSIEAFGTDAAEITKCPELELEHPEGQ